MESVYVDECGMGYSHYRKKTFLLVKIILFPLLVAALLFQPSVLYTCSCGYLAAVCTIA